jgi:hypothetical protein
MPREGGCRVRERERESPLSNGFCKRQIHPLTSQSVDKGYPIEEEEEEEEEEKIQASECKLRW